MFVVLIAGASGSGKTTLAKLLANKLGSAKARLIALDSYYKDLSHLPPAERALYNFDHPDSFDADLILEHLDLLAKGQAIEVPCYDFKTHSRTARTEPLAPTEIIIIEGIFALYWPKLREIAALSVFVNTPLETCLARRVERDQLERGRSQDSIISQWQSTVAPMYMEHVVPTKEFAGLLLQGRETYQYLPTVLEALEKAIALRK